MIIAADLATSAVRFFERIADKIPAQARAPALAQLKLDPNRVRALLDASRPLTPDQVRRSLAKSTRSSRRGTWGRRGLPADVVRAMFAEYERGASCAGVAKIFGGTRQSVHEVFKSHGLALRPRHPRLHAKVSYRGRDYTPGKDGYLRATVGEREPLHRQVWIDARGPVPAGWQVMFEDGNRANCALENLRCKPAPEVMAEQRRRQSLKRRIAV